MLHKASNRPYSKPLDPRFDHSGKTEGEQGQNQDLDPGISKRIRNSSSTMVNFTSFPNRKTALS
jgi:hypothetical protein